MIYNHTVCGHPREDEFTVSSSCDFSFYSTTIASDLLVRDKFINSYIYDLYISAKLFVMMSTVKGTNMHYANIIE